MNSAASERKSNEFWSTCSPSPSYVLIQRCCHKLRKINSVQSVGPGWKPDSIRNTTFLRETKTRERENGQQDWKCWIDLVDFLFLDINELIVTSMSWGIAFLLTLFSRIQRIFFFLKSKNHKTIIIFMPAAAQYPAECVRKCSSFWVLFIVC